MGVSETTAGLERLKDENYMKKCKERIMKDKASPTWFARVRDAALGFFLYHAHPWIQRFIIRFCPRSLLISLGRRLREREDGLSRIAPRIHRLSPYIILISGWGVTRSRAANQHYAYHHVNPAIVRIPQVYRFFEDQSTRRPEGYLFMEYLPGKTIAELDAATEGNTVSKALTQRVSDIQVHLMSIKVENGTAPGPVGGGSPKGYIWGDFGGNASFSSVEDLNHYLNKRLKHINKSIDVGPCYPLVLCHGDVVRRNIIVLDDNNGNAAYTPTDVTERELGLVDWGHSGLYPRIFEFVAMESVNEGHYDDPHRGYQFAEDLKKATYDKVKPTAVEMECYQDLLYIRSLNLRYEPSFLYVHVSTFPLL
ncbi:hypothetical protein FQN49_001964 [Arthroderma sp. PD_2]|nr:hypothetical protein FQN49_001964 [Arthroderma sp. PD_2]